MHNCESFSMFWNRIGVFSKKLAVFDSMYGSLLISLRNNFCCCENFGLDKYLMLSSSGWRAVWENVAAEIKNPKKKMMNRNMKHLWFVQHWVCGDISGERYAVWLGHSMKSIRWCGANLTHLWHRLIASVSMQTHGGFQQALSGCTRRNARCRQSQVSRFGCIWMPMDGITMRQFWPHQGGANRRLNHQ